MLRLKIKSSDETKIDRYKEILKNMRIGKY